MKETFSGWLLDIHPGETGMVLWLIAEDGTRRRLQHPFAPAFFASGPPARLRTLWQWLRSHSETVLLEKVIRQEIFLGLLPVLAVAVPCPAAIDPLFRQVAAAFPDLTYYDADLPLPLRYAARWRVFPLARCQVESEAGQILSITPLDTPWELEPAPPSLRVLHLEPALSEQETCDPLRTEPRGLQIAYRQVRFFQPLQPVPALLAQLRSILNTFDPDLIQTAWGDTWLLPALLQYSRSSGLPLPLNREAGQEVIERKEHIYFSYGQIIYRGRQVQLRGRWHIDIHNAVLWKDYGLAGVLETARLTRQPVQDAARLSPGTGISSMQFVTALENSILIPWHKQQAETPKTASELMQADMGGMIYQPTTGLHFNVGGIDFVSMYPGIMVHFNISPEVPRQPGGLRPADERTPPGIIPLTLEPLLNKRLALKRSLAQMSRWDCRRPVFQAMASAQKWLLVTCFGYLGYRNARFGRIESHEAVTACGREALLQAKETAEDLGFNILHMYVDGLWVQQPGCVTSSDFEPLLEAIRLQTGLPIALDGVYRWVVFLASRLDERVPVPNQYFGVFQDGTLKVRGIEARRRDCAPFVAETQLALIEILSCASTLQEMAPALRHAEEALNRCLADLQAGRVPMEKLLLAQKLSRELGEYARPSPAALAVRQMQAAGKTIRPGQRVRFLFTRGQPGVYAWDCAPPPDPRTLDLARYRRMLLRAARIVLAPIRQGLTGSPDPESPPSLWQVPAVPHESVWAVAS